MQHPLGTYPQLACSRKATCAILAPTDLQSLLPRSRPAMLAREHGQCDRSCECEGAAERMLLLGHVRLYPRPVLSGSVWHRRWKSTAARYCKRTELPRSAECSAYLRQEQCASAARRCERALAQSGIWRPIYIIAATMHIDNILFVAALVSTSSLTAQTQVRGGATYRGFSRVLSATVRVLRPLRGRSRSSRLALHCTASAKAEQRRRLVMLKHRFIER